MINSNGEIQLKPRRRKDTIDTYFQLMSRLKEAMHAETDYRT